MAVKKFLNDSGLAYFWSKLKTYIRGATVSQSDVSDKAKTLYYGVTSNGTPSENEQVTTISGITSYFDGLTVVLTIGPDAQYIDSININSLGSVYIYNDDNFNNALLHGNATYTFMYQTIDNEPYFIKLNTELSNKIKYDQTITAGPRNVNVGDLIAYRPSYGYGGLTDGIVGMMGSHLPFRIDYPILFSGQELNIGETGNQNYICGRFDIGFSSYFEDSKAMYIVGRLNGLEFTPEILYYSMIMQTGEPESARDYDYFLLLGYWGHSDDEFYLVPNHDIYKLQNGVFKKYLDVTVDLSSYIVNEEPSQDVQTQVAPSYAFTKEMIKDIDKLKYNVTITAGPHNINENQFIVYRPTYGYSSFSAGIVGMAGSHLPFRIDYPILFSNESLAAGGTGNQNYICGKFDIGYSSYFEDSKALYLMGNVNGLEFKPTMYHSMIVLQTGEPTEESYDDYYLLLGYWGHTSDEFYLIPNHDIFCYLDGEFKRYIDSKIINSAPLYGDPSIVAPSYAFTKEMIDNIGCIPAGSVIAYDGNDLPDGYEESDDIPADLVKFDNTGTGFSSTNVQDAIVEAASQGGSVSADQVSYNKTGTSLSSTNVQGAITELAARRICPDFTPVKLYEHSGWTSGSSAPTSGTLSQSYNNFIFLYLEFTSINAGYESQVYTVLSTSIKSNWDIQANFSLNGVSRRVFVRFPSTTSWKRQSTDNNDYSLRRIYGIGKIN